MAITGLLYLPSPPTPSAVPNPSPAGVLLSHLSQIYPSQAHRPYHIDHRLFVNTSSLLPAAAQQDSKQDQRQRQYTHLLTLSRSPHLSYVGTTSATDVSDIALITIPSQSQDQLTHLLNSKLQAQWAHRQSIVLEGAKIQLTARDDGVWSVAISDLKVAGQNARSGNTLRGIVIEIEYEEENANGVEGQDASRAETHKNYEDLFKSFLKSLFRGDKDLKISDKRVLTRKTADLGESHDTMGNNVTDREEIAEWELAKLYMEVLRGTRA